MAPQERRVGGHPVQLPPPQVPADKREAPGMCRDQGRARGAGETSAHQCSECVCPLPQPQAG